ncbi:SRPBCC family protein [Micrococcales bacterium 31B]|nr:SRPBCC family protein [Micrococcales bacterium 31B]
MSSYEVVRSRTIPASAEAAFEAVNAFKNWDHWSPWEAVDPSVSKRYEGPESGAGSQIHWEGKKAGAAHLEMLSSTPPSEESAGSIEIRLHYLRPFESTNLNRFTFESTPTGALVSWTITGDSEGFMTKAMTKTGVLQKIMGKDIEKRLQQLAAHVSA